VIDNNYLLEGFAKPFFCPISAFRNRSGFVMEQNPWFGKISHQISDTFMKAYTIINIVMILEYLLSNKYQPKS